MDLSASTVSDIVVQPPAAKQRPWITITVGGATAGAIAASLTYVATTTGARAVSEASYYTVGGLGTVASWIAGHFAGEAAAFSVRLMSQVAGQTVRESTAHGGALTAAALSVGAGVVTALTVTVGTYALEYSIEYGGKLSKEAAVAIADAYMRYKARQSGFTESGDIGLFTEDGWELVTTGATEENTEQHCVELQSFLTDVTSAAPESVSSDR